jgi:DNA-binding MarR family transcriptional regulator
MDIEQLSENEKRVLGSICYERGKYYRDLEEDLSIEKKELKKIIKKLKDLNLVQVCSLVDIEGDRTGFFGRGFTLTDLGEELHCELDDKYL